MKKTVTGVYPLPLAQLLALLPSKELMDARLARVGMTASAHDITVTGEGPAAITHTRTRLTLPERLPSGASMVTKGVREVELVAQYGVRGAIVELHAPGMAVAGKMIVEFTPAADGASVAVAAHIDVRVSVPLLGGAIEAAAVAKASSVITHDAALLRELASSGQAAASSISSSQKEH